MNAMKPAAHRPSRAAAPLAACLCAALASPAHAADETVEVFTDASRFPAADTRGAAAVYDLSAPVALVQALGRGLPRDPAQAQAVAATRFAAQRQALADAYAGHARAAQYGLAKIPATVFNQGEAVVYGTFGVAEAAALYRRWKGLP